MPDSFVQLPPDSTGKKLRTRDRLVGADTVHEQAVYNTAWETFYVLADAIGFTANRIHLAIFNGPTSGRVLRVKKLFAINNQLAAATGVAVRFDIKRITAASGGTNLTPVKVDSNNANLDPAVLVQVAGVVTEGPLMFPFVTTNDEAGATNAFPTNLIQQFGNLIPEGVETQEPVLRPGEGIAVKQITATTVGSFSWLAVLIQE